jgi:hypothetical protein
MHAMERKSQGRAESKGGTVLICCFFTLRYTSATISWLVITSADRTLIDAHSTCHEFCSFDDLSFQQTVVGDFFWPSHKYRSTGQKAGSKYMNLGNDVLER